MTHSCVVGTLGTRVRDLRTTRGLSQRQLAQAAGTSQQQIQRIETGRQSVRFDLATRIADALHASLTDVFPQVDMPLRRLRRRRPGPTWNDAIADPKISQALEQAGLDLDPEVWFLKCRLRGGAEAVFPISGPDKHRLWNAVQRGDERRFVVFRSESNEVLLNLDHTLFAHFIFEPANRIVEIDEADSHPGVRILFAGEGEFQTFEVDSDDPEPQDDDEFDEGQLRNLLVELEMSTESDHVVSFMDIDGETAFIRVSDIAVLEVPLWALYPELDIYDDDGDGGDE